MDTEKLRYLLVIQEEGSISKAADRLYMSQPSLSKAVASVEASIGCKLFLRTSGGLVPTEEGLRYLQYAKDVIALEKKVTEDLARIRQGNRKRLITWGFSFLRNAIVIPKQLTDFTSSHPNIQIMVQIASERDLFLGLLNHTIDFALLTLPLSGKVPVPLRFQELYEERLLIAVPQNNPLLEKAVFSEKDPYPYLSPSALRDQRFILSSQGSGLYELCQSFFESEHICPNIVMFEDSVQAAKRFVEEGTGICFLNEELVRLSPSPQLCYCSTSQTLPNRHAVLSWHPSAEDDPFLWPAIQFYCSVLKKNA